MGGNSEIRQARRGFASRFRRSESGNVAIEFGMLAIPFFVLIFAVIETCIIYFATSNLDSAVAGAGRLIRIGTVQAGGMTEEQFKDEVCSRLHVISNCSGTLKVDVRNFSNFGGVTFPPLVDENGNVVEDTVFQPGSAGDIVVVRVYYSWGVLSPAIIGLSNLEGGGRLVSASVAFRNEPFGDMLPSS